MATATLREQLTSGKNGLSAKPIVSRLLLVAGFAFGMTTISHAQTLGDLTNGTIVSATTGEMLPETTEKVFTTPNQKRLVLTQICTAPNIPIVVFGKSFGVITNNDGTQPSCSSFSHGFLLPAGEILECQPTGTSRSYCTMSGLLVPAQ